MDREEVTEFLGQVPLLQRLPGSSIRRIADAILVKRYEPGDYVAREGDPVDGLYIILDGQAEVSAPANTEEENRPDYVLNKYDYFGYGTNSSVHQVNVLAVSKLTCFVFPNQYGHLLQPKTIWNAEDTPENSLLERILLLEPLEVDIFRGFTLPGAPTFRQVFGGQLIGQALAAASKTVDCLKAVHSLHAIFLIAGDNNLSNNRWINFCNVSIVPIIYQVHRARDGTSFATRKVEAKQKGFVIFTLIASFQVVVVGGGRPGEIPAARVASHRAGDSN
ncbi:hypothetical protein GUJ93_ZPchr0004g40449 [Zizania palustris]|uniref:Cyclic nucleotide-binding domain-containing protein n=1 Tax=Zizania palustris TaxID=103762 RepID=A0A8J5SHD8_ZIZPA|nr:hypothetical protein GUJ93_ZPchr0004g40449 [Zizania palustris]